MSLYRLVPMAHSSWNTFSREHAATQRHPCEPDQVCPFAMW